MWNSLRGQKLNVLHGGAINVEKSAALNLGPRWQHNAARPPRPTSVLKFSFQYIFFVFELNYSKFYDKRCIPRTACATSSYIVHSIYLDFPFIVISELNINFDFLFLTTKFKSIEPRYYKTAGPPRPASSWWDTCLEVPSTIHQWTGLKAHHLLGSLNSHPQ